MTDSGTTIDEWFIARWTKFTASENYKLLQNGSAGAIFGSGALAYIKQKALEMSTQIWERPELEEHKSLLHGKMYEYPAYKAYIEHTKNYSMKFLGTDMPLFLEYDKLPNESGGSPDIISLGTSRIEAGAEIKCPKNPIYHFDRLKWKDQWDIKEQYMSCYCQMQNLLMITEADLWQFISYDERQKNPSKKIKVIDVLPDKKFQDNLDLRLRMAVKEKYKMFDEYMNS